MGHQILGFFSSIFYDFDNLLIFLRTFTKINGIYARKII
jgi:hypothetical protein